MEGVGHENQIRGPRHELGDPVSIARDECATRCPGCSHLRSRELEHLCIDVDGHDMGSRLRNRRCEITVTTAQIDDIQARFDAELGEYLRWSRPEGGPPLAVRHRRCLEEALGGHGAVSMRTSIDRITDGLEPTNRTHAAADRSARSERRVGPSAASRSRTYPGCCRPSRRKSHHQAARRLASCPR